MNPIEVIFSGLAYSFSLESLKMCLIFCSHLLENQLRSIRWPTTVTSNSNSHIKNKFPTSKSNLPRQTQIRHSKSKIVTAKTNSPHQKQICHSKNKFLTSKTNLSHQNQKQRLNGQRSMNESYLQFSLGLHPTAILFLHMVPTATFVPIKLRKR